MPKIILEPTYLELMVDERLVKTYGLEDILYNMDKLNPPKMTDSKESTVDPGCFLFPFTFPPYLKIHTQEYLNEFIQILESVFKDIDSKHHDNILFLAYTYFKVAQNKQDKIAHDNVLRKRGKLLLNLIEVPIPILNKDNIFDAFKDEPYLEEQEIREYILTYLIAASSKSEDDFLANPNDKFSDIDFKKIDKKLWIELTRRIQRDRHISIMIREITTDTSNITENTYLTISREIKFKFQPAGSLEVKKKINADGDFHNTHLLRILVSDLFNEQKRHKTDLYYALLKHDFIIDKDFELLRSTVGKFNRSSQHYYCLEALYDVLYHYIDSHELLLNNSDVKQKQIRKDFILQYFLLLRLSHASNMKKAKSSAEEIKEIRKSLDQHKFKKRGNLNYATKILTDMFKNNERPERFKPTE